MEVKYSNIHMVTVDKDLARGKNFVKVSRRKSLISKTFVPHPSIDVLMLMFINIYFSYFVISSTALCVPIINVKDQFSDLHNRYL